MARRFGIDLGTTNSVAVAVNDNGDLIELLDTSGRPHPSVVQYVADDVIAGADAKKALLHGDMAQADDVVRSPKAHLSEEVVFVAGRERSPSEVVGEVFKHLKRSARVQHQQEIDRAVVTIPISMAGDARRRLRAAAGRAGIAVDYFIHEPLAALYGHIRSQPNWRSMVYTLTRRYLIVIDWGGGTLDCTLCRIIDGVLVQITSEGNDSIGGDLFDAALQTLVKQRHSEQVGTSDYEVLPGANARLLGLCELAKIELSSMEDTRVTVAGYARTPTGELHDLNVLIRRDEFENTVRDYMRGGMQCVNDMLAQAGITDRSIDLCLAIGGVVNMPMIRQALLERFGAMRAPIVDRPECAIARGAALIAHDGHGPVLAKPIEIRLSDGMYLSVLDYNYPLPQDGKDGVPEPLHLYCVDPRDGVVKILLARPQRPGPPSIADRRIPYGFVSLAVSKDIQPMGERIEVAIRIDPDYVMIVDTRSLYSVNSGSRVEIFDLEFGLPFPSGERDGTPTELGEEAGASPHPAVDDVRSGMSEVENADTALDREPTDDNPVGEVGFPSPEQLGGVCFRSNIFHKRDRAQIPGELRVQLFPDENHHLTGQQRNDATLYPACPRFDCRRFKYEVAASGCAHCGREPVSLPVSELEPIDAVT